MEEDNTNYNYHHRQNSIQNNLGGFLGAIDNINDFNINRDYSIETNKIKKVFYLLFNLKSLTVFLILILYLVIGGTIFQALEINKESEMANIYINFFNNLQSNISKKQYDKLFKISNIKKPEDAYNYWHNLNDSIFFAFTIVSTIGYGYVTPLTYEGKVFTIFYAILGVPIGAYAFGYFSNIIIKILDLFVWINKDPLMRAYSYLGKNKDDPLEPSDIKRIFNALNLKISPEELEDIIDDADENDDGDISYDELKTVIETRNINLDAITKTKYQLYYVSILIFFYLLIGTLIFNSVENWNYLESFYFCIITITTIGLGDFYPKNNRMLVFVFSCLGLGLIAILIGLICDLTINKSTIFFFKINDQDDIINAEIIKKYFEHNDRVRLYRNSNFVWCIQLDNLMEIVLNSNIKLVGRKGDWLVNSNKSQFFFIKDEVFRKIYEKVKRRDPSDSKYRLKLNILAMENKKKYNIKEVIIKNNGNYVCNQSIKDDDYIIYDFITDTIKVLDKETFNDVYELDTRKKIDIIELKEARELMKNMIT
jgi:hypothetical protein